MKLDAINIAGYTKLQGEYYFQIKIKLVGCKHRESEGVFYVGDRGFICQIIEPVTFARCTFIFALRNIAWANI